MEKGQRGAFAAAATDVGTDVLKGMRFKAKTPDVFRTECRECGERLLGAATALAASCGFGLERKSLRNTSDLRLLIEELRRKTGDDIRVFRDETEGGPLLRLVHSREYDYGYTTYYLPFGPTYDMRPAFGKMARRFVRTACTHLNLGVLTERWYFGMITENYEMMLEDVPADEREEFLADNALLRDYMEGTISARFKEFKGEEEISRQELLSFKPKSEAEAAAVQAFLDLYDYIEADFNIWEFCASCNEFFSKSYLDENCGGFIPFAEICTVIYDFDDVAERLIDILNAESETECPEPLVATSEILPEGNKPIPEIPEEFFGIYEKVVEALTDGRLVCAGTGDGDNDNRSS